MTPLFILAFALLAVAQPQITQGPAPAQYTNDVHYLQARANKVVPGVYICKGPGWSNGCTWAPSVANACIGLPDTDSLAIGPDVGIQCMLFEKTGCQGSKTAGNLVTPGLDTVKGYQGITWTPKSFKCKPCSAEAKDCGMPGSLVTPWSTAPDLLNSW